MKRAGSIISSLMAAGICCGLVACSEDESGPEEPQPPQPTVEVTNAAAMVGGKPLSMRELESYLASRPLSRGRPPTADALSRLLDELVTAEVLYQEALRGKLDQTPAFRQTVRQMLAQQLLEQEVQSRVLARKISDEELEAYFAEHRLEYAWPEQVRLADIFISVSEDATDDERAARADLAGQVLAEALERKGDRFSFSELIGEHSDEHPRFDRGDTGLFDREGAPVGVAKPLAEAGFTLERNGQIYPGVIETPEGFHVVMRVGHRAARQRDYGDVKSELIQRIRREELERERRSYIHGLREHADIRIEADNVAKLVAEMQQKYEEGEPQVVESTDDDSGSAAPAFPSVDQ